MPRLEASSGAPATTGGYTAIERDDGSMFGAFHRVPLRAKLLSYSPHRIGEETDSDRRWHLPIMAAIRLIFGQRAVLHLALDGLNSKTC